MQTKTFRAQLFDEQDGSAGVAEDIRHVVYDTNLIVACTTRRQLHGWYEWVQSALRRGVQFWCTPIVEGEFLTHCNRCCLPEFVTVLRSGREDSLDRSRRAATRVVDALGAPMRYLADVQIVCECMDRMISCESISATMIGDGRAVFMTANVRFIRRCLYTDGHTKLFDRIIHEEGLEHLVHVHGVESSGGYMYLVSPTCSGVPQRSSLGVDGSAPPPPFS